MSGELANALLDVLAAGATNPAVRRGAHGAHGLLLRVQRLLPRRLPYDDTRAEFRGGELGRLLDTNYEKSLRNLWKAELEAPGLGFTDAAIGEKSRATARRERSGVADAIATDDFARTIARSYSAAERKALAEMLSIILHGEAYALYVSATLLAELPGTGAKIGLSMQVLEEAKHFVVMREIVRKIDRIYPQKIFDRMALEGVLATQSTQRLFGMNVMIEGVATTFFQTFRKMPGLENVLHLFQLDESRHAGFPQLYLSERPLSRWQRFSPTQQLERMGLILPLLGLIFEMEEPARVLGLDIHAFGVRCLDHVVCLAERAGFSLPLDRVDVLRLYNLLFNTYRRVSGPKTFTLEDFARFVDPAGTLDLNGPARARDRSPQYRFGEGLKSGLYRQGCAWLDARSHPS